MGRHTPEGTLWNSPSPPTIPPPGGQFSNSRLSTASRCLWCGDNGLIEWNSSSMQTGGPGHRWPRYCSFLSRANTEKQGEDRIGVSRIVKNNTPHSTGSVFFEHSDCSRYIKTRHGHLSFCSQKSSVPLNLAQCKTPGNRGLCPDTLTWFRTF